MSYDTAVLLNSQRSEYVLSTTVPMHHSLLLCCCCYYLAMYELVLLHGFESTAVLLSVKNSAQQCLALL